MLLLRIGRGIPKDSWLKWASGILLVAPLCIFLLAARLSQVRWY
jgi:hypothetical protein